MDEDEPVAASFFGVLLRPRVREELRDRSPEKGRWGVRLRDVLLAIVLEASVFWDATCLCV